jgi:hypothetical protein
MAKSQQRQKDEYQRGSRPGVRFHGEYLMSLGALPAGRNSYGNAAGHQRQDIDISGIFLVDQAHDFVRMRA